MIAAIMPHLKEKVYQKMVPKKIRQATVLQETEVRTISVKGSLKMDRLMFVPVAANVASMDMTRTALYVVQIIRIAPTRSQV